jgi:hypothetical protein
MRFLIALLAWIGAVAASIAVASAVANSIHPSQTTSSGAAAGPVPSSGASTSTAPAVVPAPPTFDPSSVKPTDPRSLFVGSNFRKALAVAAHHIGTRANIETTRVAPGDLQMTTVGKNDEQHTVTVDADGTYRSADAGLLGGSAQVYYLSQLGGNVPATLARRIAAGAHVPVSDLGYMLVHTDPGTQEFFWRVYPTRPSGIYFQALNANGPIKELGGRHPTTIR